MFAITSICSFRHKFIFTLSSGQNYTGSGFCLFPTRYDDYRNNTDESQCLPGFYETNVWDFKDMISSVRHGCYHSDVPNGTYDVLSDNYSLHK